MSDIANTVAAPDSARKRTLLLVDDEENILASLRRLLRKDGYEILVGNGGTRAGVAGAATG